MNKVKKYNQINRQMNKQIKSIGGQNLSTQPKTKTQKFFTLEELEVGTIYLDSLSSQPVLIYEAVKKSFKYYNRVSGTYETSTPIDKQLFDMV